MCRYISAVFSVLRKHAASPSLTPQITAANTYSCKALHSNRNWEKIVVSHELTAKNQCRTHLQDTVQATLKTSCLNDSGAAPRAKHQLSVLDHL